MTLFFLPPLLLKSSGVELEVSSGLHVRAIQFDCLRSREQGLLQLLHLTAVTTRIPSYHGTHAGLETGICTLDFKFRSEAEHARYRL